MRTGTLGPGPAHPAHGTVEQEAVPGGSHDRTRGQQHRGGHRRVGGVHGGTALGHRAGSRPARRSRRRARLGTGRAPVRSLRSGVRAPDGHGAARPSCGAARLCGTRGLRSTYRQRRTRRARGGTARTGAAPTGARRPAAGPGTQGSRTARAAPVGTVGRACLPHATVPVVAVPAADRTASPLRAVGVSSLRRSGAA